MAVGLYGRSGCLYGCLLLMKYMDLLSKPAGTFLNQLSKSLAAEGTKKAVRVYAVLTVNCS